jgi:outer membrane protein OmpA-like peptidoglycan-associated protein
MRHLVTTAPLILVAATAACATKKFVQTRVGEVGVKVDSLGRSIEEAQERTGRNEATLSQVDTRAQNAATTAQQAVTSAGAAQNAATAAATTARTVETKLEAFERASRRLVLQVVLNGTSGGFEFAKTDLPDAAKRHIDEMVAQLNQDPKDVYIEIEGHTDNVGPADYNEKLGLERAEAVERYLHETHHVPLHKMNVISYGMARPESDNKTKDGRAQNRRVVIRVLG